MKKKIVLAGCIMAMAMVFTGCGKKTESTTFIMSDVQEGDQEIIRLQKPVMNLQKECTGKQTEE